jgi:hypothetical protein
MTDQPKDHAEYLRAWASDIRKHSGQSVDAERLDGIAAYIDRLRATLTEISKGEGTFSRDHLTHATNCIASMKQIALDALAK